MTHLDRRALEALLDGSLPAARSRALLAHLQGGCERCAALLEREGPDLDTLARLVAAEEAAPAEPPADLWPRVEAALPRTRRRLPAWGVGLALAAALLLAVRPRPGGGPAERVKATGEAAAPGVELRVVAGHMEKGGFDLAGRLRDGDAVPRDETLIFEIAADRPAARYLFAVDGRGRATLLAPTGAAAVEPAGARQLVEGGAWVALALDDVPGPLRLVAAAGPPVDDPVSAILDPWRAGRRPPGFGLASLTLEIAP